MIASNDSRTRPITEKGIKSIQCFSKVFSKLVSNFKEANEKLIIVEGSEKLLKALKTTNSKPQTQKVLIKMYRPG